MISPLANIWGSVSSGPGTSIGAFCDIGNVEIGNNCKIQTHVSIPPGWVIGNRVFIGPGVRFANDRNPKIGQPFTPQGGVVEDDVMIGMGALIMAGVRIGKGARIGMGAIVLKDVPPNETWIGYPAHPVPPPEPLDGPH